MTIVSTSIFQPEAAVQLTRAGTGSDPRPSAWLRELEQARWNAQPRYRTGREDRALLPQSGSAGEVRDTPAAASARAGETEPLASERPIECPTKAIRSRATFAQTADALGDPPWVLSERLAGIQPNGPALRARLAAQLDHGETERAPVAKQLPAGPSAQTGALQERSVHVFVGGQAVSVWIRDAQMRDHEALRVLQSLRGLEGLRALAHQEVEVHLNGRAIARPARDRSA